jgi:membrane protein required for colicin V production
MRRHSGAGAARRPIGARLRDCCLTVVPRKWFPPVNWIDLTLLVILALFGLRGYFRGLFREIFSLAGLVAGFMMAVRYDETVASLAQAWWNVSPLVLKGVAFVAIFFIVYFLFSLTGWLLHQSAKIIFLQTLNRLGGFAVGIGKGATITAFIVFFLSSASWIPRSTRDKLDRAYLISPLSHLAGGLIRIGKEKLLPKEPGEA